MGDSLSIVVPAYNEEKAVVSTLERAQAAARGLGLESVEVILVDDGSTDRTAELAARVPGVRVLRHERNRGYGAAIKTGFAAARGSWLGFLDADGTCDPRFFADLLRLGRERGLDVAIGSRMHGASRMPVVRRLGNAIFRTLTAFLGGGGATDVASGMRVLRRDALARLLPLPDGMDFTPAMSARALLDPMLKIGEIPMPYEERVGESKLSVVGDGLRFLRSIVAVAATYRPLRVFGAAAAALAAAAAVLVLARLGGPAAPLPSYLAERRVEDWMFFRLLLATVLASSASFLAALGLVAQALVSVVNREPAEPSGGALARRFPLLGALSLVVGCWVVRRPLASYLSTGHIGAELWVFAVAGAFFALVGIQLAAFSTAYRIASLLREREAHRGGR